jgi:hypothetical protein
MYLRAGLGSRAETVECEALKSMGSYSRLAPVHGQSKTDLIVSHTSAPPITLDRQAVSEITD